MSKTKIDKKRFRDENNRYIVQGLFLEDRYNTDLAVFTYDGEDKLYKGKTYPSLKKLYLEHSDPVEYDFAITYLADWPHWERLVANKTVGAEIDKWRNELRLKLMSDGVNSLINLALQKESYQASKYLADHGWDVKERGRPSKEEIEGELNKRATKINEFETDLILLDNHRNK